MNRVKASKIKVAILSIALLGIYLIIVITYFKDNIFVGGSMMSLILLIPGRIHGAFYRDFYTGRRLVRQNNLAEALSHFEKFLSDIRENEWKRKLMWLSWGIYSKDIEAMTLNNIGSVYLKLGKLQKAQEYYEYTIKIDSKYPIPFYNLALVFAALGDENKAEEYLRQSIDLGFSYTSIDKLIQKAQQIPTFIDSRKIS